MMMMTVFIRVSAEGYCTDTRRLTTAIIPHPQRPPRPTMLPS